MATLFRLLALIVGAGLLARLTVRPLQDLAELDGAPGTGSFEVWLRAGCAATLLGCLAWWVLGATLTTLAALLVRTRPASAAAGLCVAAAERVTPMLVRRLVTLGLGAAVLGGPGLGGAASADPGELHASRPGAGSTLTGLPLPDRSVGAAPAARERPRPVSVRVRPGDSLWSLAAARLPDGTAPARVAAATDALYAANADRIGDDPDLILPGTVLHLPDPQPASPREDRP